VAVAAGESHSVALKKDGTVCAWGANSSGQLGDGTNTQRSTPVCLTLPTGVSAIAAGAQHSLALKTDGAASGTVWAWGYNFWGAVGDGSTATTRLTPLAVLANATAVGAGRGSARRTTGRYATAPGVMGRCLAAPAWGVTRHPGTTRAPEETLDGDDIE